MFKISEKTNSKENSVAIHISIHKHKKIHRKKNYNFMQNLRALEDNIITYWTGVHYFMRNITKNAVHMYLVSEMHVVSSYFRTLWVSFTKFLIPELIHKL